MEHNKWLTLANFSKKKRIHKDEYIARKKGQYTHKYAIYPDLFA